MKQLIYLCLLLLLSACGGTFLDLKPDQRQRVPASIADYAALLDNPTASNNPMNIRSSHTLGIIGADEFFISIAHWNTFPFDVRFNYQKNAYTWEKTIYEGGEIGILNPIDYEMGYKRILNCNLVLEGLDNLEARHQQDDWRLTRGTALFQRALNYYNLTQLYCPVYDQATSATALGLPLRLESDPTVTLNRASLADTYAQINEDLNASISYLPNTSPVPFRPSKAAAYALFARISLQMEDYQQAKDYADSCLNFMPTLIDFSTVDTDVNFVFPLYGMDNPEVIFTTAGFDAYIYGNTLFNADTALISSYEDGDLRTVVYFSTNSNGQVQFRGSYYGNNWFFTGLAADEVYLIRAESNARTGNLFDALRDLNDLRRHRFAKESYNELHSNDATEILSWVIAERRKELVLRGTRWEDLRRLNKDPQFATPLSRKLGNRHFDLPIGDPRWVWPFPPNAIEAGQYVQNER